MSAEGSPHIAIYGRTLSGKSAMAKDICAAHVRRGGMCIVHDPVSSWSDYDEREGFFIYENLYDFLRAVNEARGALVVIDEADLVVAHNQRENWPLATRIRHLGHVAIFISQRPKQIAPTVRDQCGAVYIFRVSRDDAKFLGNDNAVELDKAPSFPVGHFYKVSVEDGEDEETGDPIKIVTATRGKMPWA